MSDFDVTFSNDAFDVNLEDRSFDVTFDNDDFQVNFQVEGARGPQGRYYVRIYARTSTQPAQPTTALRWLPGEESNRLGSLNGDSRAYDSDGNVITGDDHNNNVTWTLIPTTGAGTLWASEALFDPVENVTFINDWSSSYEYGAPSYSFVDTSNNNTTLGVDFTNNRGTITATVDASGISGGGGGQLPTEHAHINITPSTFNVQNATVNLTGTISVNAPFTLIGTGSANGSSGNETLRTSTTDTSILDKSSVTDTTFTVRVRQDRAVQAGTFQVTADVYASYNNVIYSQTVSTTVTIRQPSPNWYSALLNTAPTNTASMTNQGEFTGTDSVTFTGVANGTRNAYIALPTRSGGYVFKSGELFLTTTVESNSFNINYTLYRIDDFIDGTANSTLNVTVTEA